MCEDTARITSWGTSSPACTQSMISGGAIVMDADLVQIHVLAGLRVGPQTLEDLDRDRVIGAPELLRDGLVNAAGRSRRRVPPGWQVP